MTTLSPCSTRRGCARTALPMLALVFAVLALGVPAAAQEDTEPFLDSLDVRLVLVDVVVEGEDGEPVLDLTAEDFEVLEDGQPVEIRSFSPPEVVGQRQTVGARRSAEEGAGQAAPRRTIVVIDEIHIHPNHRKRVLQHTRSALKGMMEEGDEVMIARFDGQLRIVQPFTADRKRVLDALERERDVRRVPMLAAWREVERTLGYLADIQEQNTDAVAPSVTGPGARPSSDDPCVQNGHIARRHAQEMHSLASQSITGLFQMVGSLARSDGRKALVYVSDGLPLTPGTAVYNFAAELCDGTGFAAGLDNVVDTSLFGSAQNTRWNPKQAQMELAEFEMSRQWRQLSALANAKEVSIYPLQASGLATARAAGVDKVRVSMRTEMAERADIRDSMHLVADQTGGSVIMDTNDFETAVEQVMAEDDHTYRLSYAPPSPGDGREHSISVQVDRPGVRVRHRKSYLDQSAEQRMADAVIATLLHGGTENPLGADLEIAPGEPPKDRGAHVVQLTVSLPLESLTTLTREGVDEGQFTVLVAARENSGRFTPVGKRVFPVEVRPATDAETQDRYVYEIALPLRGNGATIGIAVRDDVGGDVSYLKQTVDLPIS